METFDFSTFEDSVECIRAEVGKQFLSMFVKEENILEHLRFLTDYYLLGRGDFY